MVAGAIALAGFGVWAAFQGFRWLSPVGEELIVEVGEGGQIEGPDIRCGAGSQRCSTIVPTGQRVELTVKAASGFEFTGFTGDCEASGGSLLMDASKKCGARFERIGGQVSAATYTLSIDKPTGGTIVAAGITCGALGSDCSEEVPAGESVELRFQAEDNYRFDSFYKECGEGEFVMNSARTCGAVFIPAPGGVNRIPVSPPDMPERAPRRSGPDTSAPSRPKPSTTVPVQPETGTQPPAPPVGASTSTPAPTVTPANPVQEQPLAPQKPPEAPQTQEDHAKGQIKARVEEYCELRGTLDAKRVAALFHANDERQFRVTFKEYKSLACTVAGQPEYLAFDAGPAGVAKIKFEIKETIKLSSGGAPKVSEVVVTMVLSRKSQRSDWLIDRVEHAAKPK